MAGELCLQARIAHQCLLLRSAGCLRLVLLRLLGSLVCAMAWGRAFGLFPLVAATAHYWIASVLRQHTASETGLVLDAEDIDLECGQVRESVV